MTPDAIGELTLAVLFGQLVVFGLQLLVFWKQVQLGRMESEWRRIEAVGTFYRLANDLVAEFAKANQLPMAEIKADFGTHPRQMLREASRVFAPLGTRFVSATNLAGKHLDEYFSAVLAYNQAPRGRDGAARLETVQSLRERVGEDLHWANDAIPKGSRWVGADGLDFDFRALCSLPPDFLEALGIETSMPT